MLKAALLVLALGQLPAEKPPQPQTPPAPAAPKPAAPAGAPVRQAPAVRPSISVLVTDRQGRPLPKILVNAEGPTRREGTTGDDGSVMLSNVGPGTYRLRFEGPETVTFEKEVVVAAGRPVKTTAELSAAPPPPAPPKPEPAPAPAPPPPVATARPSGPPTSVVIPDYVEKNYIGRGAPSKSSPVGCTGTSTATLLQLRDPLAEHSHADADEMLYIVAGEGVQRISGMETTLTAGTFAVIPKSTPHTITRRGGNPLIVVSILSGPPCDSAK
jgi:mannose-6-phosphate isomerase-like protein (cupin superfamily)